MILYLVLHFKFYGALLTLDLKGSINVNIGGKIQVFQLLFELCLALCFPKITSQYKAM